MISLYTNELVTKKRINIIHTITDKQILPFVS